MRRFRDMLDSHGMTQYVELEVATHQEDHILDLIIARTYSCVMDTVVADLTSLCGTLSHCNAQTSFSKGTKDLPQDESNKFDFFFNRH